MGAGPTGIAYGAEAVWVANAGDGTVSRIDPLTEEVVKVIPVGNSPTGIAFGEGAVWVTVQAPIEECYFRQIAVRSSEGFITTQPVLAETNAHVLGFIAAIAGAASRASCTSTSP